MREYALVFALAWVSTGAFAQDAQNADRDRIGAILDNFDQAYRQRDGALWARYVGEDADFMQAFGVYLKGRTSIERFMTRFLASQTEAMQGKEVSRRVTFPAPNIAFAELTEEITGIRERDGTPQPPRRGHMMLILHKDRDQWSIVHYRYLDIHSGPLRPPLSTAPGTTSAQALGGWTPRGTNPQGYEMALDTAVRHNGRASCSLKSRGAQSTGFATLMQRVNAEQHRHKRLRLSAYVKSHNVLNAAGLWMRVDTQERTGAAFDNMLDRPITGTSNWSRYDIVLDVPANSTQISFGILLNGEGQVWADDFTLEVVGTNIRETRMDIPPQGEGVSVDPALPEEPTNRDCER